MPHKNTNKAYGVTSVSLRALRLAPHTVLTPLCQKGLAQVPRTEVRDEKWVFQPTINVFCRKCKRILCMYAAGTVLILARQQHFLEALRFGKSNFFPLEFMVEFQTVMDHRNILF